MHGSNAYGLWGLVVIEAGFFVLFALSFTRPRTSTDWRAFGSFSAFIVALFAEMYGFPLTIYLLSGWLARHYPGLDPLSHDSGHLLHTLLGLKGDPHMDPFHLASNVMIVFGLYLLASSWRVLYAAQKAGRLATTGPYAYVRHPQYAAFMTIMFGFLLQWPTLVTLIMFPILAITYVRLAYREEREVIAEFGEEYLDYASRTPAFIPSLRRGSGPAPAHHVRPAGP